MKNYRFCYNNNDSRYQFRNDSIALKEAKSELELLHKVDPYTFKVYVWEVLPDGKYRMVGFWKKL